MFPEHIAAAASFTCERSQPYGRSSPISGRILCDLPGVVVSASQPYALCQQTSDSPKLDDRANIRVFRGLAMPLATAFSVDGGVS